MTRTEAIDKLWIDHALLIKALNVFSATIEWSPAFVDRHDGKGIVRSSLSPTGQPSGMLFGFLIISPSEKLRNVAKSLIYRFESLQYHLTLILDLQDKYESIGARSALEDADRIELWNLHYYAHFLFDDVLFNLCSVLDYLGALLLGVLLKQSRLVIGEDGIDQSRFDWGILSKISLAVEPKTRLDSNLAGLTQKILSHDKNYVKKLFSYRNKVIHLFVRPSAPDPTKLKILIPNSFTSEVGFDALPGNHNKISLHEGCIDVTHRVTTTVIEIMEAATNALLEGQI
jgi:hypothetical protein